MSMRLGSESGELVLGPNLRHEPARFDPFAPARVQAGEHETDPAPELMSRPSSQAGLQKRVVQLGGGGERKHDLMAAMGHRQLRRPPEGGVHLRGRVEGADGRDEDPASRQSENRTLFVEKLS